MMAVSLTHVRTASKGCEGPERDRTRDGAIRGHWDDGEGIMRSWSGCRRRTEQATVPARVHCAAKRIKREFGTDMTKESKGRHPLPDDGSGGRSPRRWSPGKYDAWALRGEISLWNELMAGCLGALKDAFGGDAA